MIAISNTTIDYDRSSRQWQATRNGKVLTYPAGEQGKLGAIADAIKAADEELFAALSKMQANYPQIGKRVWKMGMLILADSAAQTSTTRSSGLGATSFVTAKISTAPIAPLFAGAHNACVSTSEPCKRCATWDGGQKTTNTTKLVTICPTHPMPK
ncbi:MAG: hypothetical protein IPK53_10330 [bacterium]|nr:hypothetical protein [bacterium]